MSNAIESLKSAIEFVCNTISESETVGAVDRFGSRADALAAVVPDIVSRCQAALESHSPLSELQAALHADADYAWTWQCNLACIGIDSVSDMANVAEDEHLTPHEAANRRAAQFMRNTFDLDIRTNEHWKEFEAQWMNETDDEAPTLEHWLEQWEAAIEAGQSSISREEAEKRYYKQHGRDHGHPNGEG